MQTNPQVTLIAESGIFDERYYLTEFDGARDLSVNAIEHYLFTGADLGLNPNPLFNSIFYLKTYPDVAAAGINPLVHYILHGATEGRLTNRFFDSAYYLALLPESERSGINPLAHYLRSSIAEKLPTHSQFDTQLYLTFYPEALATGSDPLVHFLEKGAEQKRLAHIEFDPQFYLNTYRDVAAAGLDPVQHFRLYGRAEGRLPRSAKLRFQSMESFERLLQAHLKTNALKSESPSSPVSRIMGQCERSERHTVAQVYWGAPLFERRLLEQFLEVVQKLPDICFYIHKSFLDGAVKLPQNVQVMDKMLIEQKFFEEGCLFVSPVESSPVSELILKAVLSGLLVICSDDCELSRIITPLETSMLPRGINAEKIVHAISYASANRQTSAARAEAARSKILAYSCRLAGN